MSAVLAPVLLAGLAGCYTYSNIEPATAAPGTEVRVRLSAAAAERLASSLASDSHVVSGELVANDKGAFTLEVPSVAAGTGGSSAELFQRVKLERGDLLEVERKTLSRQRTGVVVGAALVAAGAGLVAAYRGRSSGSPPVVEPPPNFVIRLLGFHF